MHIYFLAFLDQFLEQLDGSMALGDEINFAHILNGISVKFYSIFARLLMQIILGEAMHSQIIFCLDTENGLHCFLFDSLEILRGSQIGTKQNIICDIRVVQLFKITYLKYLSVAFWVGYFQALCMIMNTILNFKFASWLSFYLAGITFLVILFYIIIMNF